MVVADGTGSSVALVNYGSGGCRPAAVTCTRCGGTGRITEEKLEWESIGDVLRSTRLSFRYSQREAAQELGISPVDLSKMESGRIKPTITPEQVSAVLHPGKYPESVR